MRFERKHFLRHRLCRLSFRIEAIPFVRQRAFSVVVHRHRGNAGCCGPDYFWRRRRWSDRALSRDWHQFHSDGHN